MAKTRLIRACGFVLGTAGVVLGALYGPLVYLHVAFGIAAAWFVCWAGIELLWKEADRPTGRRGPLLYLVTRPRQASLFIILAPVLYIVSYGPACRFVYPDDWANIRRLAAFYTPLFWAIEFLPEINRGWAMGELWSYGGDSGYRVWREAQGP